MKQRFLSTVMIVAILFSIFTLPVSADTVVDRGTCGEGLDWTFYDSGELCIYGNGKMDDWSVTGIPWYSYRNIIESVIISNLVTSRVTSIGSCAFYGCESLKSITMPYSVTSIGSRAFEGCKRLQNITIPDNVTSIGDAAFGGCSSLTSITVKENNSNYSSQNGVLFNKNKTKLIKYPANKSGSYYTIPDSVTSIGDAAFGGCSSLTNITIPDSVTSIGGNAFSNCSSLTNITIPDSVTSIGDYAFSYCSSLTSITIPDSVTSIGDKVFSYCSSLTNITIPDSVTSISDYSFYSCSSLTSVVIGNSVTSIGNSAFKDCISLTNITIPDSVTSIEIGAFHNTAWYNNQPDGIVYAGKVLYKYKGSMPNNTTITIKDDIFSVAPQAFYYCENLSSVAIGNSVTSIGDAAFLACSGLTSVIIGDSVTCIDDSAFYGCESLISITVSEGNTVYSSRDGILFNKKLTELIFCPRGKDGNYSIPDSVISIGSNAFSDCKNLSSVAIPDSVTSISDYSFYCCSSLTSVVIGNSVTSIGHDAFVLCSSLTDVYYNGLRSQWSKISIYYNNGHLKNAIIHYLYIITYNANGGSNAPVSQQQKTLDEPLMLSNSIPTRSGYAFRGWAKSSSATVAEYQPGDTYSDNTDTTLYAVWKRTYNIYYSANGGSGAPETQIKIQDEPLVITSDTPVREGYSFLGWGTSSGTSVISYNCGDSYTNNTGITLYAVWKPDEYRITYHANGGSGAPEQEIKKHDTPLYIYTQHPVRYGYTFLGWSKDRKAEVPEYIEGYAAYTDNADITLYAVWKLNEYTITYDANGGYNAPAAQTLYHGGDVITTASIPSREGFEFLGWSTSRETRNVMYRPGDIYSADEDITLYAVWQASGTAGTDISWVLYNDGELVINGTGEITDSPWDKTAVKKITVESGITSIGVGVFKDCANATRVTLPVGLVRIEDEAFRNCSSFESIVVPETVERIGTYAFYNCGKLANLTLPSQLKYIESYSFALCRNLSEAVIPELAESIDDHAFYSSGLKTVIIFKDLYNIGVDAFNTLASISTVYYTGRSAEWNAIDIANGNSKLTSANINYNYRLPAVSTPTVSASNIAGGKRIAIDCADSNVTVYYTTNGSSATTSSAIYNGEFDIKTEGTYVINALAVNHANTKSTMTSKTVTVEKAASPVPSVPGGTFSQQLRLTLSCQTPGARIYYTTDGSTPNTNSTEYTSGIISIRQTTALKAISVLDGYVNSDISNYLYTIDYLPKLVTHYAYDTGKVYASYTGFTPEGSSERGFKYRKISDGNYIVKNISVQGAFEATLDEMEAGYEYECFAFDKISINGEIKEIEGDTVRFKIENPSELTLSDTYVRLYPGDSYVLVANIEGYSNQDIIWQSDNRNTVSVKDGYIMANELGSAVITASTRDGKHSAACEVAVKRQSFIPSDSIDFSEWNLAMRLSSNGSETNKSGEAVERKGANVLIGTAALAAWKGVADENDDKYPLQFPTISYNKNAQNVFHMQNAYILPKRTTPEYSEEYVENVKNAVINYGAVYAAFNQFDECWDRYEQNYYCNEYQNRSLYASHAVAIVGWDDNYSKNNFSITPPGNGAFICKNSYSEANNDSGYFYISYYDKNLGITDETMVFPGVGNSNNYDNIYQYDDFGPTFNIEQENEILTANVFSGCYVNEILQAVSFYTYDMSTNYSIYVIADYTDENDLYNLGNCAAKGSFDYAGYHTVKFDTDIAITGNKFAIAVKLSKPGSYAHAYIEMPVDTENTYINQLYSTARSNAGESYIYNYNGSGEWADLTGELTNANNCIKAFTNGTVRKISLMGAAPIAETDDIMTLEEIEQKGVNINSDFLEYAKGDIQLFGEGEADGLLPSTTGFGTYDSGIGAGNIYPSFYSLKDMSLITPVRNQGAYNTCWIHAIYASLESSVLKRIARTKETTLNGGIGAGDDIYDLGIYTPVSGINLDTTNYKIAEGNSIKLNASVEPVNANNREITWTTSNPSVADVDIYGNVSAKAVGNATITAVIIEGENQYNAVCDITVTQPALLEGIEFVNSNPHYSVEEQEFIYCRLYPTNASYQNLIWQSDNENVVTVDNNGLVTAVGGGEAKITVTDVHSSISGEIVVKVESESINAGATVQKISGRYYVTVNTDIDISEMNIYVAAYDDTDALVAFQKLNNADKQAVFDDVGIKYFKTFVWNSSMKPLSGCKRINVNSQ